MSDGVQVYDGDGRDHTITEWQHTCNIIQACIGTISAWGRSRAWTDSPESPINHILALQAIGRVLDDQMLSNDTENRVLPTILAELSKLFCLSTDPLCRRLAEDAWREIRGRMSLHSVKPNL